MQIRRRRLLPVVCFVTLIWVPLALAAKDKPITVKDEIVFGVKMAERGLWSEALFRFQQAESMGASTAAVYNNIAVAYEALGVFDKAREYYQQALTVDKDSASLRRNYSRFVEFYQSFNPDGEDEEETAQDGDAGAGEETTDPASGS